jgi:dihydrofolate synthase/folylpolyglutamate synthase
MTYDDAIAFWYGRINYEVRAAQPGDLKLERMLDLLERLGSPHRQLPIVHITGTKGKGSTSAMLDAVLREAGYRVGLFTSPHLEHVEERIRVDGEPISQAELAERMAEVAAAANAHEAAHGGPGLTFFEIGTALGFLQFAKHRCDVAVVEVGLGGRFDSTNVCLPRVAVITNVGFDHMAQLGNTLEAIAWEKAGIIKRGVPVVVGPMPPGPAAVIRRVAAEHASPLIAPAPYSGEVRLLGSHQRENAACAVAAIGVLREAGFTIADSAVTAGLAHVHWPARIELVKREPLVILDSAHNVPSAVALVRTLREGFPDVRDRSVVFAVSSDKQYEEMLRVLAEYFDTFRLTRYGNNPRCVDPGLLATTLGRLTPRRTVHIHGSSRAAWDATRSSAHANDLLCITGSVFLAGELRPLVTSGRR